jgi:SAM-dependent methyltransferase
MLSAMSPQTRVLDSEQAIEIHERFLELRSRAREIEPDSWWLKATDLTSLGYEAIVSEIINRLGHHPEGKNARLLDWGAGPGFLSYLLESQDIGTTYYDFESDCPSYAYVIGQLKADRFYIDDPVTMPFEEGSFDAATSCGVLEHVPDQADALIELNRILKPGGLLFIHHFPNHYSWTERLADRIGQDAHAVRWTRRQMLEALDAAGFDVESFDYRYLIPRNLVNYPRLSRFITKHASAIYEMDRLASRIPGLNTICTALNCVAVKR